LRNGSISSDPRRRSNGEPDGRAPLTVPIRCRWAICPQCQGFRPSVRSGYLPADEVEEYPKSVADNDHVAPRMRPERG